MTGRVFGAAEAQRLKLAIDWALQKVPKPAYTHMHTRAHTHDMWAIDWALQKVSKPACTRTHDTWALQKVPKRACSHIVCTHMTHGRCTRSPHKPARTCTRA